MPSSNRYLRRALLFHPKPGKGRARTNLSFDDIIEEVESMREPPRSSSEKDSENSDRSVKAAGEAIAPSRMNFRDC